MKNAEMKVVRFSAEDVIATSGFGACTSEYKYHALVNSFDGTYYNVTCYKYEGGTCVYTDQKEHTARRFSA